MYHQLFWVAIANLIMFGLFAGPVAAGEPSQQNSINDECLACHSRPDLVDEFPSGEVWPLHVDPQTFNDSVHGQEALLCTDCHSGIREYPHPPRAVSSRRFYQLELYQSCRECHTEVYDKSLDSMHATELGGGNWRGAICTDCHGAHDTLPANEPRTKIPETCSLCHSGIYNEYLDSVHGQALVNGSNTDVPTCIDCHGVHNQEDPRTTQFRLHSPDLCATCHADEALMDEYDISTHVFDTYVADFHGTTVTLFEHQTPNLSDQ